MKHGTGNKEFARMLEAFHQEETNQQRLSLSGKTGTGSLAGWFLGPKAENEDLLQELVGRAVSEHCAARHDYMPGDPPYVTDFIRGSQAYRHTVDALRENVEQLLGHLKGSIPLASYRNQSHMYWDTTLPGMVGYFAAMLYNQNNVAAEASPVTTLLEIEVGNDLCEMLGYEVPTPEQEAEGAIKPWGHITCDGSVANGEAMWAARNLKLLPLALAEAIRAEPQLAAGRSCTVALPTGGRARLVDLDVWSLLNLRVDEVIGLSPRLQATCGLTADQIKDALASYSVQSVGLTEFYRRFLAAEVPELPVVLAPSTAHYSWPKSAALIGLGANNLLRIHVDLDGRMDLVHLRETLDRCLREKRPVMQVVAVMGTTEESAVDPLAEIVEIREEYRQMGLEFALHCDGAWGGYFASMLRQPKHPVDDADDPGEHVPAFTMNDYVTRQYRAYRHADTQTVDPHKAGFIPYPAGALCYRNGAMRELIAFTAPVVYHGGVDPTVGVYGIEGSKPGAAAAGVYLSHSVIRTDQSGYGKLLGKCIFNSKRFYAQLVSMIDAEDIVRVTPFQRLPVERAGATPAEIAEQIAYIRRTFCMKGAPGGPSVPIGNDELVETLKADPEARALFRTLGSDQNIVTYAFNFRTANGINRSVDLMNELNTEIFEALSIREYRADAVPNDKPMFVTQSSFEVADYGQVFVDHFGSRAGLEPTSGKGITFLVSTTQNPWVTWVSHPGEPDDAAHRVNFLPTVLDALKETAIAAAVAVMRRHGLEAPQGAATGRAAHG